VVPNLRFIGLYDRGTLIRVRLCLTTPKLQHNIIRGKFYYLNMRVPKVHHNDKAISIQKEILDNVLERSPILC
jgi:hypothetical protein